MYKIKCISGTSFFRSINRNCLNFTFFDYELVKSFVEKLSIIYPDCVFEICDRGEQNAPERK